MMDRSTQRMLSRVARVTAAFAWLALAGCASMSTGGDKVLYHLNLGDEQSSDALRNMENHLEAAPGTQIVVVTHSKGVDFLMQGAMDKDGNPYSIPVEKLAAQGVEFRVCENTLKSRKLDRKQFSPIVTYVPSGATEVGRLQAQEGYAYLKP